LTCRRTKQGRCKEPGKDSAKGIGMRNAQAMQSKRKQNTRHTRS